MTIHEQSLDLAWWLDLLPAGKLQAKVADKVSELSWNIQLLENYIYALESCPVWTNEVRLSPQGTTMREAFDNLQASKQKLSATTALVEPPVKPTA